MEKYLIEQYNVFEDKNYLTKEEDIVSYFYYSGKELFECGQGYYQDEVDLICKVGDEFYNVIIKAEITSSKQDAGDRLYWVLYIDSVKYEKIDKPVPKEIENIKYNMRLTSSQRELLEKFMGEHFIEIEYM